MKAVCKYLPFSFIYHRIYKTCEVEGTNCIIELTFSEIKKWHLKELTFDEISDLAQNVMVIEGSRLILTSSVKFSPLSLYFLYSKGIAEVGRTRTQARNVPHREEGDITISEHVCLREQRSGNSGNVL